MKHSRLNIQWFDGDAAPKIVDVVRQCEGTLLKIWKVPKKIATRFYPILLASDMHKRVILLKQRFSKLAILS